MSTLARIDDLESAAATIERAKELLSSCRDVDEVKAMKDKAEAMRTYARSKGDAEEAQRAAAEIVVRCVRRIGELAPPKPTPQEYGARSRGGKGADPTSRSATSGLSRSDLERARAIASVPEEVFEERLAIARKAKREVTRNEFIRNGKRADVLESAEKDEAASDPAFYRDLYDAPAGRFRCIYADPPWSYDDEGVPGGGLATQYPSLSLSELKDMDVGRLAHEDGAHLWLWTTWPMIRQRSPHELIAAWGFAWVSEIIWNKVRFGVGRRARVKTEVLIIAERGKPQFLVDDQDGYLEVARRAHSEKPEEARVIVERCSPGPRIELFARNVPAGWDAFGNQARRVSA